MRHLADLMNTIGRKSQLLH